MLYELREAQRLFLEPLAAWASWSQPYAGNAWMRAGLGLFHRLARSYPKPAFAIESVVIDGVETGVTERAIVEKPFCRLVKFDCGRERPAVLLFAPLSGHFATLLRDTVRTLLSDFDVYITDWVDARLVPVSDGPFAFNDYVAYSVDFMRLLGPDAHVIAVCQPSVPVLAAVSAMATLGAALPRSLTLMGGPIDPRKSPTSVNHLATSRPLSWFEDNLIYRVPAGHPGRGRRVYPGFLQHLAFVSMNPDRHSESHYQYFLDLVRGDLESAEAHRRFYDEYNAVLDMDADYYLDTVGLVFQEHALPLGTMRVQLDGQSVRVNPADIRATALLTVEGELDDISGVGQTRAAHGLCAGIAPEHKHHHLALGAGHYGIFSGRRWRESIYPVVREFLRARGA